MTNIEKILFEAKFSLKYMNGEYYISGFYHRQTIRIKEDKICEFLEQDLCYMGEEEWSDFVEDYLESA